MRLVKHIALLFVLVIPFDVFCQNASLFLARDQHLPYEAALSGLENDFHTGIKPFNQRELRNVNISDSLQRNNYLTFKKPLQKTSQDEYTHRKTLTWQSKPLESFLESLQPKI